jgi:hypothetical protein
MCCEVEFFGRCVFEEGTADLFSLNVVSAAFHALLPVGVLESFELSKNYSKKSNQPCRVSSDASNCLRGRPRYRGRYRRSPADAVRW